MKCQGCGKWLALCSCPPMKVENEHAEVKPYTPNGRKDRLKVDRRRDTNSGE